MHYFSKEELVAYVRERRALFDACAIENPFTCSAWVLHFIDQVAQADWRFFVPEDTLRGNSAMLLYSTRNAPHQRLALSNYYASLYSPVISSSADRADAITDMVSQLAVSRPGCATVTLAPLDQDSPDLAALGAAFSDNHWYVKRYTCFGNWYLPTAGLSFDAYMKERPSKLYNTWARKVKKFKEPDARVEIVRDPAATLAAMNAYQSVYAKSWKQPEPYPGFVPEWAMICAKNGWLRLGIAWVDTTPIAVQFWFTMHRHAYIFKLAYDDAYAKWSAGTVLTAHMIRHSLEQDQVIEIDYLTGDDDYKKSWMTHRRERIGMIACNLRSTRGMITAVAERAGELRRVWRARRARDNEPLLNTESPEL